MSALSQLLYDAVHTGNPGDVAFYVQACQGAGAVLELGCGSGRIAGALAAAGHEVYGIDRNPCALALAARRGVHALCADMRRFWLARAFQRVLIPFNALYCLLSEDEVVACLGRARAHLAPAGRLIFDGYAMELWHASGAVPEAPPAPVEPLTTVRAAGREFHVYEQTRWRPHEQRADSSYCHVPADGGDPVRIDIPQRYLLGHQLPDLLGRAGLELEALRGGFDGAPFEAASEHLIVVAGHGRGQQTP